MKTFPADCGNDKGIWIQLSGAFYEGDVNTLATAGGAGIAGAGIGATVGLVGGPFAPITSPAGATVGTAIGGVAGAAVAGVGEMFLDLEMDVKWTLNIKVCCKRDDVTCKPQITASVPAFSSPSGAITNDSDIYVNTGMTTNYSPGWAYGQFRPGFVHASFERTLLLSDTEYLKK